MSYVHSQNLFSGESDDSDDDIDVSQPQDVLALYNPPLQMKNPIFVYDEERLIFETRQMHQIK